MIKSDFRESDHFNGDFRRSDRFRLSAFCHSTFRPPLLFRYQDIAKYCISLVQWSILDSYKPKTLTECYLISCLGHAQFRSIWSKYPNDNIISSTFYIFKFYFIVPTVLITTYSAVCIFNMLKFHYWLLQKKKKSIFLNFVN